MSGGGGSNAEARRLTEQQQKKAEEYMKLWTGTEARDAYTTREWKEGRDPSLGPNTLGIYGARTGRGRGLEGQGYWEETHYEAQEAREGLGAKYLRKQKREIDRGFTKGRAELGAAGEGRRQQIGEQGVARREDMKKSFADRGFHNSSMATQGDALVGQVESAERDQLAGSLAQGFSALELGRSQQLAGADAAYSSSMLDASGTIASILGGTSYQGSSGGGGGAGQVLGTVLPIIAAGAGCCFIMLEGRYGDGTMDDVVRRFRDEHMTERNRRGYYKVAEVLVPLMRRSRIVKWLVQTTLCDPLVSYGKWHYGENLHGWLFAPVKSAWLGLFHTVGGDTEFVRENGEYV